MWTWKLSTTDGAEKCLAARQTVPVACISDDLSVQEAEKSVTTGQGHHTVDHLEKQGVKRGNGQPYAFKVQPTGPTLIAYRTIASATLETV